MIRITAKRNGYCRANTLFRTVPTDYPNNHFTARQLAQLKADPGLSVISVEDSPRAADAARDQLRRDMERTMKVADLEAELKKMGIEIPAGAKKADLIDLIIANTQ